MAFPIIGYDNLFDDSGSTITDPGTASGFAIGDIKDHRAFKVWKSSVTTSPINIDIDLGVGNSANPDYIALVNHNLTTLGATVTVQSDDEATYTAPNEAQAAYTPTADAVDFQGFTAIGADRYWRVVITAPAPPHASAPFIGDVLLGVRTTLTEYMQPGFDPFHKQVEVASERSEGGHYLGATLRGITRRAEIAFGPAGAARAGFTSDLNAFIDNHAMKRLPFIFVLDTADSDFSSPRWLKVPDEAQIGREAVGGVWSRLILRLPVEEALMEVA